MSEAGFPFIGCRTTVWGTSARSSIWTERLTTDQKVGDSSSSGRATRNPRHRPGVSSFSALRNTSFCLGGRMVAVPGGHTAVTAGCASTIRVPPGVPTAPGLWPGVLLCPSERCLLPGGTSGVGLGRADCGCRVARVDGRRFEFLRACQRESLFRKGSRSYPSAYQAAENSHFYRIFIRIAAGPQLSGGLEQSAAPRDPFTVRTGEWLDA